MTVPDPNIATRRQARVRAERAARQLPGAPAQHVRERRRVRTVFAALGMSVLLVGGTVSITTALAGPVVSDAAVAPVAEAPRDDIRVRVAPMPADGLPSPTISSLQATGTALCDDEAIRGALAGDDDGAVIAATGSAGAFRAAVATGAAPCIPLDDPSRVWVIVDKLRPFVPVDYAPDDLVRPEGVRSLVDSTLRQDAASALTTMVAAAADAGAGEIATESAYRSYSTQRQTYAGHVANRGVEGADLVSARPGFSEHQSGLTVDVVPCDGSCATIDDLAASPQGAWIAEHAWEFGWIVRYEEGRTDVTGYVPEPWHLRYIGVDLAAEYHAGGWSTLEEFFGLPAAPDYAD